MAVLFAAAVTSCKGLLRHCLACTLTDWTIGLLSDHFNVRYYVRTLLQ
jgi:hypothetical protein